MVRSAVALGVGLVVGLLASCGAEHLVAPAAEVSADLQQCRGFERLMPNFVRALETGRTEHLKTVIEEHLLQPDREGEPPPVNEVLRAIFKTLTAFASRAAEPGARGGAYCAPSAEPPPLEQANELCELRRALELLVHEGKGIDAIEVLEPQLVILLNYITGRGADCLGRPRVAHYELAGLFSELCSQDLNCRLEDGLDLVIGYAAFARTPEGRRFAEHLNALADSQMITDFLDPDSLSEDDFVAIAKGLLPALQAADIPALENALPASIKDDPTLKALLEDLKGLVQREAIMQPLRRSLTCVFGSPGPGGVFTGKDKAFDTIRLLHRLAIAEQCDAFGLTRLTEVARGLQDVDQRGSLMYLAGTLAAAVRDDEFAIDAAANVCRTLFSTAPQPGQVRSNAELALPAAAELVEAGVVNEAICAADTLIFGCAGGAQPACR